MNLDSLTIAALADELRLATMGGRVQRTVQVSDSIYGLEIYAERQRHQLILSADPTASGAYLQNQKPRRGVGEPTPILQLLKKYVLGSRLMVVEQPGLDRILHFEFSGAEGEVSLILELLGTRCNLIFTDTAGQILALSRPVPPGQSRHRVLLPSRAYVPPPPQSNKVEALSLSPARLQTLLGNCAASQPLDRCLTRHILGLSRLIATEIVYRAFGETKVAVSEVVSEADAAALLAEIKPVFERIQAHQWEPVIVFKADGGVKTCASLPLTHLPGSQTVERVSAVLEQAYNEDRDAYEAVRASVAQRVKQAESRLQRRLKRLREDEARLRDPVTLRQKGEAILAYSYQLTPHQTELKAPWTDDETLVIELDPQLSPPENAERYFKRYQKAKRAKEIIPAQQREVGWQLQYVQQLANDLEQAESRPEIDAVADALGELHLKLNKGGGNKKKQKRAKQGRPTRLTSPDGFLVWLGRNARQNAIVTFDLAGSNDWWFHARSVPGAHVVVPTSQGEPPQSTLDWAAGVAAYYSRARFESAVDVICTRKKYVRSVKGALPGMVTFSNDKTLRVPPVNPTEVQ